MYKYVTKSIVCMLLFVPMALTAYADDAKMPKAPPCTSEDACKNDPNCQCWCSQGCGYRAKQENDNPIYVEGEEDEWGKKCYCKQWDYDNYNNNCIQGKNIPQEPGAK